MVNHLPKMIMWILMTSDLNILKFSINYGLWHKVTKFIWCYNNDIKYEKQHVFKTVFISVLLINITISYHFPWKWMTSFLNLVWLKFLIPTIWVKNGKVALLLINFLSSILISCHYIWKKTIQSCWKFITKWICNHDKRRWFFFISEKYYQNIKKTTYMETIK